METKYLSNTNTPFFERKVAGKFPQLVLNAALPLSNRRDDITEENGATVSRDGAEYRLRATTSANSRAVLKSRQRGNYLSGSILESGLGVRVPVQPTGDAYVRWGYFNDDNGMYFEYTKDGLFCVLKSSGTVLERTEQADWNLDRLDGGCKSAGTLTVSDGHVYQIPFLYYGYGDIQYEVGIYKDFNYKVVKAHSIKMNGDISIEEPNLPVKVDVNSGTSGVQLDAYVGGRQISSLGDSDPVARTTEGTRLARAISTSFRPLISFRHKTGFENILVRLGALDIFSTVDGIFEIQRNAILSGASFTYKGNQVEAEKAVEIDVSAGDTYTNGECIYRGSFEGGTGAVSNSKSALLPERPVSELDTITLAARTLSGTGTIDLSMLRVTEDW